MQFFLKPSLLHCKRITHDTGRSCVLYTSCDENPDHEANLVTSGCEIRQNQFGTLVSISFIVQGHLIIHDRPLDKYKIETMSKGGQTSVRFRPEPVGGHDKTRLSDLKRGQEATMLPTVDTGSLVYWTIVDHTSLPTLLLSPRY